MPILETLWSYLNWTPRQQRPPTPPEFPVQQSPLSHGVSELCQWSQIPGVDGAADWDLGSSTTGDRVIASGLSLGSDRVRGSAPLSAVRVVRLAISKIAADLSRKLVMPEGSLQGIELHVHDHDADYQSVGGSG